MYELAFGGSIQNTIDLFKTSRYVGDLFLTFDSSEDFDDTFNALLQSTIKFNLPQSRKWKVNLPFWLSTSTK